MPPMPLSKRRAALLALPAVVVAATAAWSGHELPIYPSYYPQEIRIDTVAPDQAADLLLASKIQAYVGGIPRFAAPPPDQVRAVESLGSFVVVRINPGSLLAADEACAAAGTLLRGLDRSVAGFVLHPYPVTPFHGDYLDHADLADAAAARWLAGAEPAATPPKVKAEGALAQKLVPQAWQHDQDVDATVAEVGAADLVAASALATNAWLGPPWLRAGWFQAALILGDAADGPDRRQAIEADLARLKGADYENAVERINLARELVTRLTGGCRKIVAGYTVKREYFSAEYSDGIENVGIDAIEGLNSPIFIRTAKLKDFPWNGDLAVGTPARPTSAWNPIAGFDDPFGRLLWAALGDLALIPSPNDGAWMLNRTADVAAGR